MSSRTTNITKMDQALPRILATPKERLNCSFTLIIVEAIAHATEVSSAARYLRAKGVCESFGVAASSYGRLIHDPHVPAAWQARQCSSLHCIEDVMLVCSGRLDCELSLADGVAVFTKRLEWGQSSKGL